MEVLTSSHPSKAIDSNYFDVPSARYGSRSYQTASLEQSQYQLRNPPTPPRDNSMNMSLPPISSLLSFSRDDNRANEHTAHQNPHYPAYRDATRPAPVNSAGQREDRRSNSIASNASQHLKLPPTPPMQSYVTNSHSHSPPQNQRPQPPPLTTSGVLHYDPVSHAHNYRQVSHTQTAQERAFSSQPSYSPHATTAPPLPALSSPMSAPNGATTPHSTGYHPSPLSASHRTAYQQRPLPTDFPPPIHLPTLPSHGPQNNTSPTSNQTTRVEAPDRHSPKHEHARSPVSLGGVRNQQSSSSSASSHAPQLQDRYVCPTCGKAFSRPSSLRIHGHSHTGEKPFKCPHKNCGKAFSVRSNMKRHEKGCHAERERRLDLGPGGASRELLPAVAS